MNSFIKDLLAEYRDNYKTIYIIQELDETKKKLIISERIAQKSTELNISDIPSGAWQQISELDSLSVLRDDNRFDEYKLNFLNYLGFAEKVILII